MPIKTEHIRIASQGRPIVAGAVIVAFAVTVTAGVAWSIPVWVLVIGAVYALRDPVRITPAVPLAVVSPVDGRVISVGAATDPYNPREALRVRLRMYRRGAYLLRSPIEGKIFEQWFAELAPGAIKDRLRPADEEGRGAGPVGSSCRAVWVKTDEGDDLTMVIRRGCPVCRPRFYVATGGRVGHGQRCGFLWGGGGVVDVFVPANSRLDCSAGDRVLAGSAIIATLVHK